MAGAAGERRRTGIARAVVLVFFLLCATLARTALCEAGAGELKVSLPETVKGFTPCEIRIDSPAAGEAELKLLDEMNNPWLTIRKAVSAGENVLPWDGLGANLEPLRAEPYRFEVMVRESDGTERRATARFSIDGTTPTLVYALPSSETLYLDHRERWFVECFVSARCSVAMEVLDGNGEQAFYKEFLIREAAGKALDWAGNTTGRKLLEPGVYSVRMWSLTNPGYDHSFRLNVEEHRPKAQKADVTGPVLPERGMSDAETWEIMMKPSVVIEGRGAWRRYPLYARKSTGSRTVANLRCAMQGLEILESDGTWVYARAGNHNTGKPAEGYQLVRNLKVVKPSGRYGVLVDKRDQTLTVYEDGKKIGTVPVSTGLPAGRDAYLETPAGAFLTDVHTGPSFAQEGYRYEYPLRYDGMNFIHGSGYAKSERVRDYSRNLALLGQKASHGCIRVSLFAQEDCPITSYWLWTHLPYHTRVIVLDD